MKRNFRLQIFSWLLLILFSYNIIGCYVTFFAWKLWMHEQLEALASALPNDQLTLFKLTSTEKIESEMCVDGKMFDVVKTKENNGITYCYCIRDFEEETLAATISDANPSGKAKQDLTKAIKTLQKKNGEKYTPMAGSYLFPKEIIVEINDSEHAQHTSASFISKHSPPPKA